MCDGTGWDGMGWDGMGWDGIGWDGVHATQECMTRHDKTWRMTPCVCVTMMH